MVMCSAFGCNNTGTHLFPKESKLRKQWEAALSRKNFHASKHSRLCSGHFKSEDYHTEGWYSGVKYQRNILRHGVVPSVFSWKKSLQDPAAERRKKRAQSRAIRQHVTSQIKSVKQSEEFLHEVSHEIEVFSEENETLKGVETIMQQYRTRHTKKLCFLHDRIFQG